MESKKKIDFLHFYFLFIVLLFLTSCEDLFLRFKYQTIDCKENSFNLKKSIKTILNDRIKFYNQAQIHIKVDKLIISEIVDKIIKELENQIIKL